MTGEIQDHSQKYDPKIEKELDKSIDILKDICFRLKLILEFVDVFHYYDKLSKEDYCKCSWKYFQDKIIFENIINKKLSKEEKDIVEFFYFDTNFTSRMNLFNIFFNLKSSEKYIKTIENLKLIDRKFLNKEQIFDLDKSYEWMKNLHIMIYQIMGIE